jgi:hypothetical protein
MILIPRLLFLALHGASVAARSRVAASSPRRSARRQRLRAVM